MVVYMDNSAERYATRLEDAVSRQIYTELAALDMEQQTLGAKIGLTRAALNRYLRGHRSMALPTLFLIAQSLGISPHELLQRAEARIENEKPEVIPEPPSRAYRNRLNPPRATGVI